MKKSEVQELYNEFKIPEISMNDINLNGVIVSKIGRHAGDSLRDTLEKKTEDLENMEKRYGEEAYCIWSHGKLNPENTYNFCDKISDNGKRKVYVFMPYTPSDSTANNGQASKNDPFDLWKTYDGEIKRKIEDYPPMNPVTGPDGSNRGFIIDKFYHLKENIDFQKFVSFYLTNAKDGVKREAVDTLYPLLSSGLRSKGCSCSNMCIELKNEFDKSKIMEKCISDNLETSILVARLKSPYHVILERATKSAAIGVK